MIGTLQRLREARAMSQRVSDAALLQAFQREGLMLWIKFSVLKTLAIAITAYPLWFITGATWIAACMDGLALLYLLASTLLFIVRIQNAERREPNEYSAPP